MLAFIQGIATGFVLLIATLLFFLWELYRWFATGRSLLFTVLAVVVKIITVPVNLLLPQERS